MKENVNLLCLYPWTKFKLQTKFGMLLFRKKAFRQDVWLNDNWKNGISQIGFEKMSIVRVPGLNLYEI